MRTFHVITAEVNESLKTALITEEELEGNNLEDYFPYEAKNIEAHGTVEIEGVAEDMIPDYLVEG